MLPQAGTLLVPYNRALVIRSHNLIVPQKNSSHINHKSQTTLLLPETLVFVVLYKLFIFRLPLQPSIQMSIMHRCTEHGHAPGL